ncbi:MAG: HYR domain-containing protein, partial [Flavobacteriaceae bacterium]|nr:HYR domain-containing protein [Flavobacteriaceae bacterium]
MKNKHFYRYLFLIFFGMNSFLLMAHTAAIRNFDGIALSSDYERLLIDNLASCNANLGVTLNKVESDQSFLFFNMISDVTKPISPLSINFDPNKVINEDFGSDTPPNAVCSDYTVQLDSSGSAVIVAADIDGGSNDAQGGVTLAVSSSSFDCSNLGVNSVTLTVTDSSGQIATCVASVTVVDNLEPNVATPVAVSVSTDTGCTATNVTLDTPIATDNCLLASITNNAPTVFPLGDTTVTWTVTDSSGNTAVVTQVVTVVDDEMPSITAPANVTVDTNTGCTATNVSLGTPAAGDNCTGAFLSNDAPAAFPLGDTTVTWTVTDGSENTNTATQLVTVVDTEVPSLTAPADITVDANTGCTATNVVLGTPTTSDNCTISVSNNAPTAFPLGNTSVIWTVTDSSGNSVTATQMVTVIDNTAPTAVVQDISVTIDATGNASITAAEIDNGSFDACGIASMVVEPTSFNCSSIGTNPVLFTVTDASGNSSSATANVTVLDDESPSITTPANVTVTIDTGCTATNVTLDTPIATDNCSVASLVNNAPTIFPLGNTEVTWTATDSAGNVTTAIEIVTVLDNTNPTVVTQDVSVNLDENGNVSITAEMIDNGSSDACGIGSMSVSPSSFSCSEIGTNSVTLEVTDVSGNTSSAAATVTVIDNEPPSITAPTALTVNTNTGCTATNVNLGTPTNTDNCSVASLVNNAPT